MCTAPPAYPFFQDFFNKKSNSNSMAAGSLGSVLVDWNGPGIGLGLVWDRFEVSPGSVWDPRGLGLGAVWV